MRGLSYSILLNGFQILFSFLNGSKKNAKFDSNNVKMTIIFSEISQKLPIS